MLAQSLARERNDTGYHLDDPRCMAQAYTLALVANQSSSRLQIYELERQDPH